MPTNDYTTDDYCSEDYFITTTAVVVVVDIDVGAPGSQKHRTSLGSTQTLDLLDMPAGSPWAPYDIQSILVIWNHMGIYAFSRRMLPDEFQVLAYYTDSTLISLSSITFAAEPIGTNLLGSVSAGQRPTGQAVIANQNNWWNPRVNDEAFLSMGCGSFVLVRGLYTMPILTGTIGRLSLEEDVAIIDFGMFPSDQPTEKVWFI